MVSSLITRIPEERVGVLIGPNGSLKRKIEKLFDVKLSVSSETGEIELEPSKETGDPTAPLKARNVVVAIGRGFSPAKALRLQEDDLLLEIIDLRDHVGRSRADLERLKGRLIGREGRTRQIIEETTDADVSIYGHTIAIIGRPEELTVAKDAVQKLISGSEHRTVYRYLSRMRHEIKKERLKLWE